MSQPVEPRLDWAALEGRMGSRKDEIDDLLALLVEHADPSAGPEPERHHVAWLIACACLGDGHLGQDMGLPTRDALSLLIQRWFPALAARNVDNMKWKKFLYKQLCLREELLICKEPSCDVCPDHRVCFGPEEAPAITSA